MADLSLHYWFTVSDFDFLPSFMPAFPFVSPSLLPACVGSFLLSFFLCVPFLLYFFHVFVPVLFYLSSLLPFRLASFCVVSLWFSFCPFPLSWFSTLLSITQSP
jgi:hypothetical protein